jgi:uncharacterized protein YcfJ
VLVRKQAPVKDVRRIAGTAIGAVLGGVLAHPDWSRQWQYAGDTGGRCGGELCGQPPSSQPAQPSDRLTTKETRCKTPYDTEHKHRGYEVTYRLGDKQGVVRMSYTPGQSRSRAANWW